MGQLLKSIKENYRSRLARPILLSVTIFNSNGKSPPKTISKALGAIIGKFCSFFVYVEL